LHAYTLLNTFPDPSHVDLLVSLEIPLNPEIPRANPLEYLTQRITLITIAIKIGQNRTMKDLQV
jgi:hypothetical protein